MSDQIKRKEVTRPERRAAQDRKDAPTLVTRSHDKNQLTVDGSGAHPKAQPPGDSKQSQALPPGKPSAISRSARHQHVPPGLLVEVEHDGDSMVFWFSGRAA